jgi:hypothetical protein
LLFYVLTFTALDGLHLHLYMLCLYYGVTTKRAYAESKKGTFYGYPFKAIVWSCRTKYR